jgi:hypothetical protein
MIPTRVVVAVVTLLGAALPLSAYAAPETGAAPPRTAPVKPERSGRQRVVLTEQHGTKLEVDARAAVARDLADAGRAGDDPLLLVGSAELGGPKDPPALFVQIQSARQCGSAGCNTSVHIFRRNGWQRVVDTVSGPIMVDTQRHGGMRDLIFNGRDRWTWNGRAYVSSRSAPPPPASLQKKAPVSRSG